MKTASASQCHGEKNTDKGEGDGEGGLVIFYRELRALLYKRDSRTGTSTPGRGNSKYEGPEWGPVWPIWSFPEKQRGLGGRHGGCMCGRRGGCKETAVGDEGREVAEMTNVVGRIMTPQRCPHLKPWKL